MKFSKVWEEPSSNAFDTSDEDAPEMSQMTKRANKTLNEKPQNK